MDGKRLLHSLKLTNFLSYGSEGVEIELQPLNVLIGPNASGKSNLIEAIDLLRAAPTDLAGPIRMGGGVDAWLWKGQENVPFAEIETIVDSGPRGRMPLRYRLRFTKEGQRMEVVDEVVEEEKPRSPTEDDVYFFYRYEGGHPVLNVRTREDQTTESETPQIRRKLSREDLSPDQSVLSQRKDPDQYPELTHLGRQFTQLRLYREWNLGRNTPPRMPQPTDLPGDFLLEDASNLGLVLNNLEHKGVISPILEKLKEFFPQAQRITVRIEGASVQLFLHEEGKHQPIPATRLSDGTLRYLCLLTILCHPEPPPLICLEEPELGLHPDVLRTVAELLIEASSRTQLIVTTHSDALVSGLTDVPESVIVCEADEDGSKLKRLDKDRLEHWLDEYMLGDVWRMGEIGGNL